MSIKVDIGFWDSQGNYIPDIQKVSEVEMDKCKLFQNEECIYDVETILNCEDCMHKQLQQLKAENEEIRKINDANAKLMIKLRDCLDEIEEIANTLECDCAIREILQKIKEVKGE